MAEDPILDTIKSHTDQDMGRRKFLTTTLASAAAFGFAGDSRLPAHAEQSPPARKRPVSHNDKIPIAIIGCGGMGTFNMTKLMEKPEVQIVALCDVDSAHFAKASALVEKKYGRKPRTYKDYRRVLDRDDVKAVLIATPDHWHALPLIYACDAGKDVYCEKPISHNIIEAKAMDEAVRNSKRVVQVGTWQRSIREFMNAVAYIRAGKLGRVTQIRAWKTDNEKVGRLAASKPPATLDYDLWTGPAEKVPYREKAVHFNWRWFLNYGSGMTGDWGVHMIDIALLAMGEGTTLPMPAEVYATGGKWAFPGDDRTAPDTVVAMLKFKNPDFVLHWETQRSHPGKPDQGVEFISADGRSLMVWRRGWKVVDKAGKEMPKEALDREQVPIVEDHWQNWLDCMRTRKAPRSPLSSMAQTTIVCHLINAAQQSESVVRWDSAAVDILGRAGKNTLSYEREYRAPWQLPRTS